MATAYEVELLFRGGNTAALDRLERRLGDLERKLAGGVGGRDPFAPLTSSAAGATRGVGALAAAFGPLLAGITAYGALQRVFSKTAELETQTRSIQVLTGSLTQTKDVITQLQQYGAVTPFTSSELIDTARQLKAFGVETKDLVATTKQLGDVSGATGADLQGIALAYGQVLAKGRLQGEELLQFQERGIALGQELRREYGLTAVQFQKALEGGRIPAEAVVETFRRLTTEGGKYFGGAANQADTLSGRLSTLQDNFDGIARTVGAAFAPALNERIKRLSDFLGLANDALSKLNTDVGEVTLTAAEFVLKLVLIQKGLDALVRGRAALAALWATNVAGMDATGAAATGAAGKVAVLSGAMRGLLRFGLVTLTIDVVIRGVEKIAQVNAALKDITDAPGTKEWTKNLGGGAQTKDFWQRQLDDIQKFRRQAQDELSKIRFPWLTGRDEVLQARILQYDTRIAQLRTNLERAPAKAAQTPLPPLLTGKDAGRPDPGAKMTVIGGMTGGGQAGPSRGRSTGPHLHGQGEGDLILKIDAALEFPGGRTASSYGISRGAAGHGYNAVDYLTPQGTPFRLRPGWSAQDLGIRGALGRGMRVTGPMGSFELGHLAGVEMGSGPSAWSTAEQTARDAERAAEEAKQRRMEQLSKEEERLRLTYQRDSAGKPRRVALEMEAKLNNDLLYIDRERAKVRPDPNVEARGAAAKAENLQRQAEVLRDIAAIGPQVSDLEGKYSKMFAVDADPLQKEIASIEEDFAGLNRTVDDLLAKLADLGGDPALRERLLKLKADIAAADTPGMGRERLALRLREGLEGDIARTRAERRGPPSQAALLQLDKTYQALPAAQQQVLDGLAKQLDAEKIANAEFERTRGLVQDIGSALSTGLSSAIDGLIRGTTTLKEAFADILGNIGKILIQNSISGLLGTINIGGTPLVPKFAEGGYVAGPTLAEVGEGGESEYIIPSSKMGSAMARYSAGARGDAVLQPGGDGEGFGPMAEGGVPGVSVTFAGDIMRFEGTDYVRQDQIPAVVREAALQGAKIGEQRTIRRMQQSPGTRRRLGL